MEQTPAIHPASTRRGMLLGVALGSGAIGASNHARVHRHGSAPSAPDSRLAGQSAPVVPGFLWLFVPWLYSP